MFEEGLRTALEAELKRLVRSAGALTSDPSRGAGTPWGTASPSARPRREALAPGFARISRAELAACPPPPAYDAGGTTGERDRDTVGAGGVALMDAPVEEADREAAREAQRLPTDAAGGLAAAQEHLRAAREALAAVDLDTESDDDIAEATDELHRLGNQLDAAQLDLLRAVDARKIHMREGAVTMVAWLRLRTRIDHRAAFRFSQAARLLPRFPALAGRLAGGEISLAHVFAVTDRAKPRRVDGLTEYDDTLAQLATTNPPTDVRRAVKRIVDLLDADGSGVPPLPDGPDPRRGLTLTEGINGLGDLRATLDPVTREGLMALLDALDEPDAPGGLTRSPEQRRHDAFAKLVTKALGIRDLPTVQGARPHVLLTVDLAALLGLDPADPDAMDIVRALAEELGIELEELSDAEAGATADDADAGEAARGAEAGATADDADAGEAARGAEAGATASDAARDAAADDAEAGEAARGADRGERTGGTSGTVGPGNAAANLSAAGRDAADWPPDPSWWPPPGSPLQAPRAPDADDPLAALPRIPARLASGVPLHLPRVRRLIQHATVQAVLMLGPWRAVNVGGRHRTLPPWLRTVLRSIHRHCRGPGCDRPVPWTEAHHVTPWSHARTTDLNDTLPLCQAHHELVTNDGWDARLDRPSGRVTWYRRDGLTVIAHPSV